MEKDNWTLIDKKTQIVSLIILIVAIIVVSSIFISYIIKLNIIFGISSSSILSLIIFLVIVSAIIDIIFLMYFIGRRIGLKKQKEEKIRKIKKSMNIKIVFLVFILIISILWLNYMYDLKPYEGISINDITDNPDEYVNQTVSIQAFYVHSSRGYPTIYQDSYFHSKYSSGKSSLYIRIGEDIDTSMLMDGQEYIWNGIILNEPYIHLNVTKIDTLYDNIERHNISKFIGSWRRIDYESEYFLEENLTWIFYENNTLREVNKSRGDVPLDSHEHFAVDNKDEIIYYEQKEYLFGECLITGTFCNYYFSENDTKLTLEIITGGMIPSWKEGYIMVFQKSDT